MPEEAPAGVDTRSTLSFRYVYLSSLRLLDPGLESELLEGGERFNLGWGLCPGNTSMKSHLIWDGGREVEVWILEAEALFVPEALPKCFKSCDRYQEIRRSI